MRSLFSEDGQSQKEEESNNTKPIDIIENLIDESFGGLDVAEEDSKMMEEK